jgi:hypothetical protein
MKNRILVFQALSSFFERSKPLQAAYEFSNHINYSLYYESNRRRLRFGLASFLSIPRRAPFSFSPTKHPSCSTVKAWRGCDATGGCGEVLITKSEREKLE